jgi:hypothetical protein
MSGRKAVVLAVVAVAAAVLVGSVVAGGFDWSRSSDELQTALAETRPTRVSDIPAADGLPARGVFAQITSTGHFCLSDAPLDVPVAGGGGGCNAADDPLGGSVISSSLAYDGGPAIEAVRDARLIGLAAASVASVRILMSDGSSRAVKLRTSTVGDRGLQVFGFRVRKSDLKKGVGPIAVVALDESGSEVARQTTGIG